MPNASGSAGRPYRAGEGCDAQHRGHHARARDVGGWPEDRAEVRARCSRKGRAEGSSLSPARRTKSTAKACG
eukprot:2995595-Prymnesium_polylepis.1